MTGRCVLLTASALLCATMAMAQYVGGDVDRRGGGPRGEGRWGSRGGDIQMPTRSVIDGPISPADLLALIPTLAPEQQRLYVAAYDSATAAMQPQRDTLHAYMAAHRPPPRSRPGERPEGGPAGDGGPGSPPPDGDDGPGRQEDDAPPPSDGPIPGAGSADDPGRRSRRAYAQDVLRLAAPLQDAQDAFEALMPHILTKQQLKTYKKWFDERNEVKRQYPRWLGRTDPNADGEQFGR